MTKVNHKSGVRVRDNRSHGDNDVSRCSLGLGITEVTETMMYPDVHFLGGKLVTVREVDVTTKAHQRHEGSPYSP